MAKDISGLNNKTENGGEAPRGVLTPKDWNTLVEAVMENQDEVAKSVRGVILNGITYTQLDPNGYITMEISEGDYNVSMEFSETPPTVIAKGEPCKVKFSITNKPKGSSEAHNMPATAKFYVGSEHVGTITDIYDKDYQDEFNPNPLKVVEFDFAKATQLSADNVLTVELDNGEGGEDSKVKKQFKTKVVNASLTTTLTGGVNNKYIFTESNPANLIVVMNGADGLLYIKIDDELVVDARPISMDSTYDNFADIFKAKNNHGVHTLSIWASPKDYPSIRVNTPDIEYIYGDVNNTNPIVITNITDNQEFEVYDDVVVNYSAYWAEAAPDTKVSVTIKKGNKQIFGTESNAEFSKNIANGECRISLFPNEGETIDSITGDLVLEVKMGSFTNTYNIKVSKSSNIELKAQDGWDVYLSTRLNGANNDQKVWQNTNNKGQTYKAIFSDNVEFIPAGSGFNKDDEGYVAMRLKKGRFFTLDYQPFKENPTWSGRPDNPKHGTGKTLSFEFAVRNCLDLNTEIIKCVDETGVGLTITANNILLASSKADSKISCDFKENERIRVDITIDGRLRHYVYDTVKGTGGAIMRGESDEALMIIYINGVYQKLALIKQDASFKQTTPQYITFGSNKCDLDVYNVRIYNSTVYMNNIVKNYAADTPNTKEAVELMRRNDIFDSASDNLPNIDLGKLINSARTELPIMYLTMDPSYEDKLPNDKDNWKDLTKMRWYNPLSKDTKDNGNSSFETRFGTFKNQGTSSMNYPWPWRNFDFKLNKSDEIDENGKKKKGYFEIPTIGGIKTNKWIQYEGMPGGIAKITLKKDYASSEMCNNAICSEIFTDMAKGIANNHNVLSPAMKENGGATTNYRLTFKATPCFAIQTLNDGNNTLKPMGMMNLIPNKNEVVYLGMDKSPYTWEETRTQAWEVSENHVNWDTPYYTYFAATDTRPVEEGGPQEKNGVFGYYRMVEVKKKDENGNYILDEDGNFTYETVEKYIGNYDNGLAGNYEARYPKDTTVFKEGDFGFGPDEDISEAEFNSLYNEQYDILDFHNWLVATNLYCVTNEALTDLYDNYVVEDWNLKAGDGINPKYTHDTKAYRQDKFKNESETRLIKDQWILYYIWREQFWMFDSGSKNLQIYTMGKANSDVDYMQWGCMVRDADTALGINNLGVDMFPPHLEDTDCYSLNADGSVRFHYDEAFGLYNSKQLPDGKYSVLNGQFGSIWLNIRDHWGEDIRKMYRSLSSNPNKTYFSAEKAIERFDEHQSHWCESLYNWGMRQYFGGDPFTSQISSGNGNKKYSRKNWLEKGFYYRNSKYKNLSDYVTWRGRAYKTKQATDSGLNIKTYIPMYVATGGSTPAMDADGFKTFRITNPNEGVIIPSGANGFAFKYGEDTNTYLFGSDNITDLGDLARFVKLKSEGPSISAIIFPSVMSKLTSLRLGHHVDINKPGHETPYTETVNDEEVVLTNNLATFLNLNNLPALTYLDITNHVALSDIAIDKCTQLEELYASGTDRIKSITFPQTTTLKEIHVGAGLTQLNIEDLTGIEVFDWDKAYMSEAGEGEVLEKPGMGKLELLRIKNCGNLLKGNTSYNIVKESIDSLVDSYANNRYDSVCELYDVNWTDVDESILIKLLDIDAELTGKIAVKSLSFNTKLRLLSKYTSIDNDGDTLQVTYPPVKIGEISMPENTYFDSVGSKQLKFTVKNTKGNDFVSMQWSMTPANSQYAKLNTKSGVLTITKIGTEEEAPSADVTVTITLTGGKTASATGKINFFLRSCKVGDYVFNDGTYMDTLQEDKTPIGVCFYIDPSPDHKDRRLMVALDNVATRSAVWGLAPDRTNSIIGVELDSDPDYDCYDIYKINNITESGVVDYPGLIPGYTGPNPYESSYNLTDEVYRAGRESNDYFTEFEDIYSYGDIGWKTTPFEIDIENDGIYHEARSIMPIGLYKTLAIIEHRNKILSDSSVGLPIPTESASSTELQDLNNCITTYKSGNQHHLYYPAASACYAYEPKVDNLDNKFKKHTWWLPTSGEILRILYYALNNLPEFQKPISDGKLIFNTSHEYSTSTEADHTNLIEVRPNSRAATVQKYIDQNYIRPINKF